MGPGHGRRRTTTERTNRYLIFRQCRLMPLVQTILHPLALGILVAAVLPIPANGKGWRRQRRTQVT